MGYTFKQLRLKNFKYVTDERPLEFQFDNRNIVILDGQNGYGKTTLFDAIEILLTGKIKKPASHPFRKILNWKINYKN